jgi:hypothetical protein
VPEVAIASNEITLNFGIQAFFAPLPNQTDWDAAAQEFADNDFEVGNVKYGVITPFDTGGLAAVSEKYDCFYQQSNPVPDADLSLLLPLDPLINSDPNFDRDDIVGGALEQLRREEQTWGLPVTISPEGFWYNPSIFTENGAFFPYEGWSTGDFESALRTLRINPDDTAPFASREANGTYLLLLIAAYGGKPIDFSTSPYLLNYTDAATVQAIEQVLQLARDGYIKYTPLAQTGATVFFGGDDTLYAMYSDLLGGFFNIGGDDEEDSGNQYSLSTFPQGTQYTAAAYDVGSFHISATTQYAEACFRLGSYLMTQIDIFGGMPVLRSQINDAELLNTQGQPAVDFYNAMDRLIEDSATIVIPSGFNGSGGGEALVIFWLYGAFDRFVADEATDLAKELADAQLFGNAYLECLAQIPPEEQNPDDLIGSYRQWRECAIKVDPNTESLLPSF